MRKRLLLDMPYFVEIARNKSFSKAADILDVPVSTLSRRIAALEKELGVRLLLRSTRSVELTEAGLRLYEGSEYLLSELDRMGDQLVEDQHNPAGQVRLSMPADVYYLYMQGAFCSFARQYPKISMQVFFSARWMAPATDPVDLDIRGGELPDSSLVRRKLADINPAIYASPKLLECYPAPEKPADLSLLPFIAYAKESRYTIDLRKEGRLETPLLKPVHIVNSLGLSLEFVLDGLGASLIVPFVARKYEEDGRLIRLLPEWSAESVELSVVMAPGRLPQRVRLLVEHLVGHFSQCQE